MKAPRRPRYSWLLLLSSKSTFVTPTNAAARATSGAIKTLARVRQLLQQRRGGEVCRADLVAVLQERLAHAAQSHLIGVEHRAAAPGGKAEAVQPDDVDLVRPRHQARRDEVCALVDHGIKATLEDLLVGHGTPRHPARGAVSLDQCRDLRIRAGAPLGVVAVPAGAALLPETAESYELLDEVRGALARGQSRKARPPRRQHHVEAAQIVDGKRAERKAELHQHAVDLVRQGTLLQQKQRLTRAARQHAVGDETLARTDQHRKLAEAL